MKLNVCKKVMMAVIILAIIAAITAAVFLAVKYLKPADESSEPEESVISEVESVEESNIEQSLPIDESEAISDDESENELTIDESEEVSDVSEVEVVVHKAEEEVEIASGKLVYAFTLPTQDTAESIFFFTYENEKSSDTTAVEFDLSTIKFIINGEECETVTKLADIDTGEIHEATVVNFEVGVENTLWVVTKYIGEFDQFTVMIGEESATFEVYTD